MPNFFSLMNAEPAVPLLANIPHSSAVIPSEYRGALLLDDTQLQEEQRKIVDWFTDELYSAVAERGGSALVNRASRLIVDPERYEEDSKEVMAARGVGVIYERTTERKILRKAPSKRERDSLLDTFYRPYHTALTAQTRKIVEKFGVCLILDCHSFPEQELPYELKPDSYRPQICIGTDEIHTPDSLTRSIEAVSAQFGYSSACNTPFGGTIVPLPLYGDRRVRSVMLEINRGLYMDERSTQKLPSFPSVRSYVAGVVEAALTSLL